MVVTCVICGSELFFVQNEVYEIVTLLGFSIVGFPNFEKPTLIRAGRMYTDKQTGPDQVLGQNHANWRRAADFAWL